MLITCTEVLEIFARHSAAAQFDHVRTKKIFWIIYIWRWISTSDAIYPLQGFQSRGTVVWLSLLILIIVSFNKYSRIWLPIHWALTLRLRLEMLCRSLNPRLETCSATLVVTKWVGCWILKIYEKLWKLLERRNFIQTINLRLEHHFCSPQGRHLHRLDPVGPDFFQLQEKSCIRPYNTPHTIFVLC